MPAPPQPAAFRVLSPFTVRFSVAPYPTLMQELMSWDFVIFKSSMVRLTVVKLLIKMPFVVVPVKVLPSNSATLSESITM